jgi:calcium/calmodulin-dependent protein kinase I
MHTHASFRPSPPPFLHNTKQLLDGLVYIHSLGIVHRDLKLENLMLSRKGSITEGLKIVDFGLARFNAPFDEDDMCGTPLYVAPEVVGALGPGGSTGAAAVTICVDTWAAGVILYMLLSGAAPFMHADDNALFSLIRKGVLDFKAPIWAPVSSSAKSLIAALVVVKPEDRLTAAAARRHAWFGADVPATPLAAAQDGLRKLAARRKFKGAVKHIVAAQRMHSIVRSSSSTSAGNGGTPRAESASGGGDAAAAAAAS